MMVLEELTPPDLTSLHYLDLPVISHQWGHPQSVFFMFLLSMTQLKHVRMLMPESLHELFVCVQEVGHLHFNRRRTTFSGTSGICKLEELMEESGGSTLSPLLNNTRTGFHLATRLPLGGHPKQNYSMAMKRLKINVFGS